MRLGRTSRTNPLSVALLLVQVTVWRSAAYLEREPRLRRVESWKKLLPWLDPPAAKLRDGQPFFVVWNAPSFRCGRQYDMPMDLKKFGIVANDLELFHGDVINLFYENRLGLYPKILRNGISFNGGIPQLANLTAHLEWVKADVEWYIPNKTYDGLAVIDWEAWQPLFERNHGRGKRRYLLRALAVVMSRHPWWRGRHVYTKTQREFDAAARRLMDATQSLCQRLRPNAKWGFYLFPSCFNKRPYQNYCTKSTLHQNDQLHWLFRKSKALYPSIYLKYQQHPEVQRLYVEGVLRETFRVSMRHGRKDAQVIPYARYTYPKNSQFYTKSDLESSIGQAADSGAAGVVLWETYKNIQNRSDCLKVRSYLHTVLGPFVSDVLKFTERCSQELCHGRGRCVSRQWSSYGLLSTREHPIHRVRARPRRTVRQDRRESVPLSNLSATLGKVEFTAGVNDLTEFTSDGMEKNVSSNYDYVDTTQIGSDGNDFPEKRIFSNTLGYKSADDNENTGGVKGVHLKASTNSFDTKPIKTSDLEIPSTIGIASSPVVESTKPLVLESISIEPLSDRSSFSESFSTQMASELLTPTAFLSSTVLSSDLVPATENIPTPALSAELLPSTEFLPTPFLSSEPLRSAGSFTKTLLTSALSSSESLPKALSSSEFVSSTESPSTTPLSLELVSSAESSPTLIPFSSELISRSELLPMDVSSSELPPSAVSWPTPSVSIELLSSVEVLPTTHLSSELLSSTKPLPMEPLSSELASVTESFSTPLASKLISSTQSLPVLPFPTELLESPGHLFSEPLSTLQYVPVSSVSSVNPVSERTASISANSAHTKFTASEQSNSPEVPALTEGKKTYPTKTNQQQKVLKRKKLKSKINIENATTHKKRRRRRRKKKKTMHRYSNYRCRCYDGWTGNFCQHQIFK